MTDTKKDHAANIASLKGKYAMAKRWGTEADVVEAKREFAAAKIEAFIERTVSEAPPLTAEQRAHLAALLIGGEVK